MRSFEPDPTTQASDGWNSFKTKTGLVPARCVDSVINDSNYDQSGPRANVVGLKSGLSGLLGVWQQIKDKAGESSGQVHF